ncbi:MAG TPA: phage baseplate assembly protein V [Xanthobacteraceae bacterium]|nr:phage baseplate assembly protein V [Xanthobacteraceae bacterium]
MATVEDHFAAVYRRLIELEQRLDKMVRHGTVVDIDPKKHLVRLKVGGSDDEPLKSPWVPYAQIAGALKIHSMPSFGQTMTLICPTGDFRQAVAIPLTWSNENPSPSDKPDEHVLTFGDVRVTLKKDDLEIKVGNACFSISKEEAFAAVGDNRLGVFSGGVYSVKATRLGLDNEGEKNDTFPKAVTDAGPSKQVQAKV